LNIPKDLNQLNKAFSALKQAGTTTGLSIQSLSDALSGLKNRQLVSVITTKQNAQAIQDLSSDNLLLALGIKNVDEAQKEEIASKIKLLSLKIANGEATKQERREYQALFDTMKSENVGGSSVGMRAGMAIAVSATTAITSFSSSRQARSAGEAFGKTVGGFIMSGITGAMLGAQIGGTGAIIGAMAGLALPAISSLIGYQVGATERTKELVRESHNSANTFKDQSKSIEETKNKLIDLRKAIDSNTLSEDDANSKRKELYDIQKNLIEQYGKVAEGIDLVTGSIDEQIEAIERLGKADYNDFLRNNMRAIDEAKNYFESSTKGKRLLHQHWEFTTEGTPHERLRQLEAEFSKVQETQKNLGDPTNYYQTILNKLSDQIKSLTTEISTFDVVYSRFIEGLIQKDDRYSRDYAAVIKARANLDKASAEDREAAQVALFKALNDAMHNSRSNESIVEYYKSLYLELQGIFDKIQFKINFEANTDGLADSVQKALDDLPGYKSGDILQIGDMGGTPEQKDAYEFLEGAAKNAGISIAQLIDVLVQLGMIEVSPVIAVDTFPETLDEITTKANLLTKAMAEQSYAGKISRKTYEELYNKGEEYRKLLDIVGDDYVLLTDKVEDFGAELVKQAINTAIANGATEDQIALLKELLGIFEPNTDLVQKFEDAFGDWQKAANDFEKSVRFDKVKAELDALEKKAKETLKAEDINNWQNALNKLNKSTGRFENIASHITNIKDLGSAWKEFKDTGSISASVLDKLMVSMGVTAEQVNALHRAFESGNKAEVEYQLANIAEQYIRNKIATEDLTESQKRQLEIELRSIGVKNALIVIEQQIAANKIKQLNLGSSLVTELADEAKAWLSVAYAAGTYERVLDLINQKKRVLESGAPGSEYAAHLIGGEINRLLNGNLNEIDFNVNLNALAGGSKDSTDKWKEAAEAEIATIRHLLKMEQITIQKFHEELDRIYQKYYAGRAKYIKEDRALLEELFDLDRKIFGKALTDIEQQIFLALERGGTKQDQIKFYDDMMEEIFQKSVYWRSKGLDDESEYIQELQKKYYGYRDTRNQINESIYTDWLNASKYDIEVLRHNDADKRLIVLSWREVINGIEAELERFSGKTDEYSRQRLETLTKELWDAKGQVISTLNEMADAAKAALDSINGVYEALKKGAQEFAENGFLTISTFQQILSYGVEYLSYLEGENGQLVINEDRIKAVIKAKIDKLAIETALLHVEAVAEAHRNGEVETLNKLIFHTAELTGATWDLVYARARMIGLDKEYEEGLIRQISVLQDLSFITQQGVGEATGKFSDALREQSKALDDLLRYVMEMIRKEIQLQIDGIREQIQAYKQIVELQKQSLRLAREKDNYDKSIAKKLKDIAELERRINLLKLDDSREALAERRGLEEQLADLQEKLVDEQSEHHYQKTVETLDDMAKKYEESKNEEIKILEKSISSQEKIYRMAIERISNNWNTLYQDLIAWNYEYGSSLEKDLRSAWDNASQAVMKYGSYLEAVMQTQQQLNALTTNSFSSFGSYSPPGVAGGTQNRDTSGSQTINQINSIVAQMKSNSNQWNASDAAARPDVYNALNAKQHELASQIAYLLGQPVVRGGDGEWYIGQIGGKKLYNEFPKFHSGGIVDGGDDEIFALLKRGELVLTKPQKKAAYDLIDLSTYLMDKFGVAIDKFKPLTTPSNNVLDSINNMSAMGDSIENVPNNSVAIEMGGIHLYGVDDVDKAHKIGKGAADGVLDQLKGGFSRVGRRNLSGAALKP